MSSDTLAGLQQQQRKETLNVLQEMLSRCTPDQQDLFHRMYPEGPADEQMDWAFQQVERTLRKVAG